MNQERRHKCAYCGKKRIERNMIKVPDTILDNKPVGFFWACSHQYYESANCVLKYLDMRANAFYQLGDKFKSAADKYKKYKKL